VINVTEVKQPVIRFELGSKRVYRNSSEYHTKPTCRYGDTVVEGYGSLISKLASILPEKNPQINPLVEVWRGDTLVFHAAPLKSWVSGLPTKGGQPEQLKRDVR